ncbi:MAG: LysR family transcriptional regulator [Casimicrobiaceae bacterium]|nr:LysR family transcriptional regulator [Casimicrobiaceae bacterium]
MGPHNRPLDLDWLEDFVALAKLRSFSRAAEARFIAQPAFSRHIRALEEWVGVDLVDRGSHPVELTAAGQRLLPLVEETLAGLEAARIKACAAADEDAVSLRLAVTHTLALEFFPGWLGQIERDSRFGSIVTFTDGFESCCLHLEQRRVQFVLCYGHPEIANTLDERGYAHVCLGRERLVAVSAPDDAGRPRHDPHRGVGPASWLAYSRASFLARAVEPRMRPFLERDWAIKVAFEAPHAPLLRHLALAGRGFAWLPERLVSADLAAGRLVRCTALADAVPLDIRLYRGRHRLNAAAEALWAVNLGAVEADGASTRPEQAAESPVSG